MKKIFLILLMLILLCSTAYAANSFYIIANGNVANETKTQIVELFSAVEEKTGIKLFILYNRQAEFDLDDMASQMLNDIFSDSESQIVVYYSESLNQIGYAQTEGIDVLLNGVDAKEKVTQLGTDEGFDADARILFLGRLLTQLVYYQGNTYDTSDVIDSALSVPIEPDSGELYLPLILTICGITVLGCLCIVFVLRRQRRQNP